MHHFLKKDRIAQNLAKSLLILFCLVAPACATTVTLSTPTNGATISAPVTVQASASSANPIDGWHIYDNDADVFAIHGVSSINTSLNLSSGNHTLVVRAWDNTGAFGDQTVNITVAQSGPPPSCGSTPTVTLTTPTSGSTVTAPVSIQASACSANPIAGWHIYDNSNDVFSASGISAINASLNLAAGSHTLIVRAWDNTGAFGDKTVNITVQTGGTPPPPSCGSTPTVTLTKPTSGSTVTAPVSVQASACSANPIAGWHIYDNGNDAFGVSGVSSINASLNLAAGSHTLIVRAWDNTGAFGDKTASITVGQSSSGGVPASNHVYVVVLENHSFNQVIGNPAMPNLNNMANSYSLATSYFANTHPSIGNYFEMTTGQIITNDDTFSSTVFDDNIVRHLLSAGKTWKEYSENLPNVGYTGGDCCGGYVQHHNPLAYFSDVRGTARANNLVPFTRLQTDINNGTLPNFGFIVPNNCDNAHDCSLDTTDSWLQNNIFNTLLQSAPFQSGGDGLLFIVFDEADQSDSTNGGGQVAAILIGPKVKNGFQSTTFYQHQSLLRTINDALGLSNFGDATSAPSMAEFFK